MSAERPATRREAVRLGALAAGAVAAAGLIRPLSAVAQISPETERLRDFLAEAAGREQILALAYAQAGQVQGIDPELEQALELMRQQVQAHVNALSSAIETIGFDAPDAPSDPQDDGVFDDVDGIDSETAEELKGLLASVGEERNERAFLKFLIDLNRTDVIPFYLERAPAIDSEDMRTTSAQITANLAQHVLVLTRLSGKSLAAALTGQPLVAAGGDSASDEE